MSLRRSKNFYQTFRFLPFNRGTTHRKRPFWVEIGPFFSQTGYFSPCILQESCLSELILSAATVCTLRLEQWT